MGTTLIAITAASCTHSIIGVTGGVNAPVSTTISGPMVESVSTSLAPTVGLVFDWETTDRWHIVLSPTYRRQSTFAEIMGTLYNKRLQETVTLKGAFVGHSEFADLSLSTAYYFGKAQDWQPFLSVGLTASFTGYPLAWRTDSIGVYGYEYRRDGQRSDTPRLLPWRTLGVLYQVGVALPSSTWYRFQLSSRFIQKLVSDPEQMIYTTSTGYSNGWQTLFFLTVPNLSVSLELQLQFLL